MSKMSEFTLATYFQDIKTPEELQGTGDVVVTKDEQMMMISIVDEVLTMLRNENMLLRKMLWLRHGCTIVGLYGDDREMQCNHCMIDFKETSAEGIQQQWQNNAIRAYLINPEIQRTVKEIWEKGVEKK